PRAASLPGADAAEGAVPAGDSGTRQTEQSGQKNPNPNPIPYRTESETESGPDSEVPSTLSPLRRGGGARGGRALGHCPQAHASPDGQPAAGFAHDDDEPLTAQDKKRIRQWHAIRNEMDWRSLPKEVREETTAVIKQCGTMWEYAATMDDTVSRLNPKIGSCPSSQCRPHVRKPS